MNKYIKSTVGKGGKDVTELNVTNAYLQVQHYIFVVQAQDTGRPSLSSTVTVYFNVLDLNDNAPLFDPMSYSDELYENITVGSSVITVSATDQDSGKFQLFFKERNKTKHTQNVFIYNYLLFFPLCKHQGDNGKLVYSIIGGNENEQFRITQNGTIMTAKPLDRETQSLYNLIIMATDQAKPPEKRLSSNVQVIFPCRLMLKNHLPKLNKMCSALTYLTILNVRLVSFYSRLQSY